MRGCELRIGKAGAGIWQHPEGMAYREKSYGGLSIAFLFLAKAAKPSSAGAGEALHENMAILLKQGGTAYRIMRDNDKQLRRFLCFWVIRQQFSKKMLIHDAFYAIFHPKMTNSELARKKKPDVY